MLACFVFLTLSLAVYSQFLLLDKVFYPTLSKEEKEHILEVNLNIPQLRGQEARLIDRLARLPEVEDILRTEDSPLSQSRVHSVFQEGFPNEVINRCVDTNFMSFLNLPLLGGHVFRHPGEVVVDAELAHVLQDEPLGKTFELVGKHTNMVSVCGWTEVLPEFYTEGASAGIWRLCENPTCCYVKVRPHCLPAAIEKINGIVTESLPEGIAFQPLSLQEIIENTLMLEKQVKPMLFFFTVVCLLITVFGIYSAITDDCARRRKEMAIRKINGASALRIAGLFTRFYLILLSGVVAVGLPFLWGGIQVWLSNYRFHFYHGCCFGIAIIGVMCLITAFTVGWRIWVVVHSKPMDVLRDE